MNNHRTFTIDEILSRGVEQILPDKDALAELLEKRKIRVFLGIDPTGAHLTLGHAVVLGKLQQFADLGHDVILLVGNGTVKIGDPTGKDSTRPELTDDEIEKNFKSWKEQASKILDFSKITIKHNGDWLNVLTYSDIVKLMAKTTVQQLLERDMFQERLREGRPIHGHEIMYPLLQGYDSVVMDIDLEIGGSDQLFNMMMGRTLQKEYNNREKWVLTTPIINGTDGRKMSKSYGNYVALTEDNINMYGKLMRVSDEEIVTYFTALTDIDMSEVGEISQAIEAGKNPMIYKKQLAFSITEMLHTTALAEEAQAHFEKTVQGSEVPLDTPTLSLSHSEIELLELLKLALPEESSSNLRRLIEQAGVQLLPSEQRPTDFKQVLKTKDIDVIKVGKRKFFKVVLEQ